MMDYFNVDTKKCRVAMPYISVAPTAHSAKVHYIDTETKEKSSQVKLSIAHMQ